MIDKISKILRDNFDLSNDAPTTNLYEEKCKDVAKEILEILLIMGGGKFICKECGHYLKKETEPEEKPNGTFVGYTVFNCTNENCGESYDAKFVNGRYEPVY